MNCPACEGDNRKGAHFCRHCGAQLVQLPASGEPVAPEAGQAGADASAPGPVDDGAEAEELLSEAVSADVPSSETGSESKPVGGEDGGPGHEGGEVETGAEAEESAQVGESVEPEREETLDVEEGALKAGEDGPIVESEAEELSGEAAGEDAGAEPQADVVEESAEHEGDGEVSPLPEWIEDQDADLAAETDVDVPGFWRDKIENLAPVAEGTVIADRYMVSDVLDAQETAILYYAKDLWRCWQCGFEGNGPTEAFCAQCGASLDRKPSVRLLEVGDADAEPPTGETVAARLFHEGRTILVLAEPEFKRPARPERKSIRLLVGQRSDAGQVRELDEDSLLCLTLAPSYGSRTGPVLGLFAVADGMGGHEGGEVASKLALQVLADQVVRTIFLPELRGEFRLDEDIVVRLRQATMAANDDVYLARQKRGNDMGTTLTAVLIRDSRFFVAHVGDCRAYRWSADGLEQLTVDHSVVASMVASGQAAPEEIYTHPHRSVIYRSVGDQPTVQVDTDVLRLEPGDRIIICCDGLWEMVRSEGIEDVMLEESEPQAACDLLVSRANLAGGDDNISVIIVQVEAV